MISAAIVADSVSPQGKRLTTYKVRYPWFIHGEVMTHRTLSRNASSNRAIPLRKMLEEARSDELRAEPVYWGAEQKGMAPGNELSDAYKEAAQLSWRHAAHEASKRAEEMAALGVHKSLCNRVLMPYTHANVVLTGTEWDNFYGLRLHMDADPTMRALALAMWEARAASTPKLLQPEEWHLPFVDEQTMWDCRVKRPMDCTMLTQIMVSVARCARVSYESFETGKRSTVEEDLKLYDRLVGAQPLHASPAEHQATPDTFERTDTIGGARWWHPDQHGNLDGWCQYRKMLPGEAVAPLPEYIWERENQRRAVNAADADDDGQGGASLGDCEMIRTLAWFFVGIAIGTSFNSGKAWSQTPPSLRFAEPENRSYLYGLVQKDGMETFIMPAPPEPGYIMPAPPGLGYLMRITPDNRVEFDWPAVERCAEDSSTYNFAAHFYCQLAVAARKETCEGYPSITIDGKEQAFVFVVSQDPGRLDIRVNWKNAYRCAAENLPATFFSHPWALKTQCLIIMAARRPCEVVS